VAELTQTSLKTRLLPYAIEEIKDGKFLVSGYFSGWAILSEEEVSLLRSERHHESPALCKKLEDSGIIINSRNVEKAAEIYRGTNRNLFSPPSLHMINVTNTCNYRCRYCHAGVSQGKDIMSEKTALKVLKFIFQSGGPCITIEFQGGECLLNWKVVRLITEKARELNKAFRKDLHICIVSNLSLMDEEKLKFLTDHDVAICTSLDGSREIHDANRRTALGQDTFQTTKERMRFIKDYYRSRGQDRKVDVLATITRAALSDPKAIVDMYIELGIKTLHLRPVHNFGDALSRWPQLTYTPEEFYEFWKEAMEYIFKLNRNGIDIIERGAYNIIRRIFHNDAYYVELMSPTGMGRTALLYNYDGAVFNSDEGRMIPERIFQIGTVDEDPKEVLTSKENVSVWTSSFMDLLSYNSAFRPWGGIHPVKIYQDQGTIIPNISEHSEYKIYTLQCRYLFEKIAEDGFEKRLLLDWCNKIIK